VRITGGIDAEIGSVEAFKSTMCGLTGKKTILTAAVVVLVAVVMAVDIVLGTVFVTVTSFVDNAVVGRVSGGVYIELSLASDRIGNNFSGENDRSSGHRDDRSDSDPAMGTRTKTSQRAQTCSKGETCVEYLCCGLV
jgi:hypothetical protein